MTNNFGDISITTGPSSNVGAGSGFSQTVNVTINDPDALHRVGVAAQELADLLGGTGEVAELREAGKEVARTAKDPAKAEQAALAGKRLQAALNLLIGSSSALNIISILGAAATAALG